MTIEQTLAVSLVTVSLAAIDKSRQLELLLDEIQKTSVASADPAKLEGPVDLVVTLVQVKQCSDLMRELGDAVNDANSALRKVRKDTLSKLPKGTDTKQMFGTSTEAEPPSEAAS